MIAFYINKNLYRVCNPKYNIQRMIRGILKASAFCLRFLLKTTFVNANQKDRSQKIESLNGIGYVSIQLNILYVTYEHMSNFM